MTYYQAQQLLAVLGRIADIASWSCAALWLLLLFKRMGGKGQ